MVWSQQSLHVTLYFVYSKEISVNNALVEFLYEPLKRLKASVDCLQSRIKCTYFLKHLHKASMEYIWRSQVLIFIHFFCFGQLNFADSLGMYWLCSNNDVVGVLKIVSTKYLYLFRSYLWGLTWFDPGSKVLSGFAIQSLQ